MEAEEWGFVRTIEIEGDGFPNFRSIESRKTRPQLAPFST